jgi:YidC/Oxa1 family membrane protein insertase
LEFLGTIWQSFSNLLLNILVAINSVVHVPGIAIIIFTILMRMLTVPLTMKALRSSRNMQQIQPLVKEIQKKYGKDRQKQQEETMKLYRDYGVNPAAGCLPMLIQLPIFFGLFSALTFTLQHGGDVNMLKQVLWVEDWTTSGVANFSQAFLWVPNLAKADPAFVWPVLSGLFQFIQSRMAMPRRDPNNPMDPQQRMMQNIMQFMPIYIVFISVGFPAGTVIYWAFSSVFGAVQQYFITGFGSLPDLPGMGFLPRKAIEPPKPLHPDQIALNTNKRKGVMAKMMERALEAQEAQKTAQPQSAAEARAGVTSDAPTVATLKSGSASRNRSSGASSALARQVRATATTATGDTPRFTSTNFAVVEDSKANGAKAPAQLPRKRKNKR